MILEPATIGSLFDRAIVETGRLPAFLYFVALLGTFGFIRTSTHMIRAQVSWWPGNVQVGGTHVHHLVWGIVVMMIVGYVGVVLQPGPPVHGIIAILLGIGTGLTLDEFALWLELKDVYWEHDGRKSVDAMVIAGCVAGMVLVGFSAWVAIADDVEREVIAAVGLVGVLGIALAAINAAKAKLWWALASIVIPVSGIPAALRLAKPHSLWARLFYHHGHGRLLERARRRYGDAGAGAGSPPPSGSPSPSPSSSAAGESETAGQSSS